MLLSNSINIISQVGQKRAELFAKELNIRTIEDLVTYYPYKYVDKSRIYNISESYTVSDGMIQISGRISRVEKVGMMHKERLVAILYDQSAQIELVWFKNYKYIENKLKVGQSYIVFGKPTRFGQKINMVHPEIEEMTEESMASGVGLQAFYNTTEVMKKRYLTTKVIRDIISYLFNNVNLDIDETLGADQISRYNYPSRYEALYQVHLPSDIESLHRAQERLKYEELFYIQLSLLFKASKKRVSYSGYRFTRVGDYFNRFYRDYLPFELTQAQKRVIHEIYDDLRSGCQMNRLLQGDVGSGKTMVALMVSLLALDNGFQAAIMAPTEILSQQHYLSIKGLLSDMPICIELLTGSIKGKKREQILCDLKEGRIDILIGTHALLEDSVQFNNLGLAIIDEQHRFGVEQRSKLWLKNKQAPHILVMTATPIPRTLAMTVYGDLEVSVINELPPGRQPVSTYHYFDNKRAQLYQFLHKQIALGRQIYIVYPLIQENETMDIKDLEQGYENVCREFCNDRVVMVHGRMRPAEKEAAMQEFADGKAQIMVATTVIEVGVNVPNASVMVIESAERFGLSQLHQLRGRVGRGAAQSFCILMSKIELSSDTRRRLMILCQTNDGFAIAEADMDMRGPGDIEGTAQSGLPFELRIASLATDGLLLQRAREDAKRILERDPELKSEINQLYINRMQALQKSDRNWGVIS